MAEDPFEDLFGLEDKFYDEGFKQGFSDGSRQSRISTRLFGIEKGYEKFFLMGQLQAKARIWEARLRPERPHTTETSLLEEPTSYSFKQNGLLPLKPNVRLEKHLETLIALVDPSTLSMENTDDAVAEFDDRLKRAQAKEKIIERIIGADPQVSPDASPTQAQAAPKMRAATNMEDFGMK